jgi:molecular chaperone Hsp33
MLTHDDAIFSATDGITSFHLESGRLRGRLVRVSHVLDELLGKHDYPQPVARLVAEAVATSTALASMLSFTGRFTLQARGDGAVTLLVADTMHDGGLRAYARYDADAVAKMGDEGIGLLGQGHLAFTIEPADPDQESYQGIVELRGMNLAAAAQNYFRQSEQIPTGLMSAAQQTATGAWQAACIIIQQMPETGGVVYETLPDMTAAEFWQHVMVLMSSCTLTELLDPLLPPETLLYRLFHGEGMATTSQQSLHHHCGCSARIEAAVRLFDRADITEMAENGIVTMNCQFCSHVYHYDSTEIERIFTA